jgi:hypothetical protein
MGERFAQASEMELRTELAQLWKRTGVDKSKLTEIATILTSREGKKRPAIADKFMEKVVISHQPTVITEQESQLQLSVDSHPAPSSANQSIERPATSAVPEPAQQAIPQQSVNPPVNRPAETQTPQPRVNPQPAQQTIRRAAGENLEHEEKNPMFTPQQHKVFEGAVGFAGKIEHWTQLANELDVAVGTIQKVWDEVRKAILEEILPQTHHMAPDQLTEKVGLPKPVADAMSDQELRWSREQAQERE